MIGQRLIGSVLLVVALLGLSPELAAVAAPDLDASIARIIAAPLHPDGIASAGEAAPGRETASGIFIFSCPIASGAIAWETRIASGFCVRGLRIHIGIQDPSGLDWIYTNDDWTWDGQGGGESYPDPTLVPNYLAQTAPARASIEGMRLGPENFGGAVHFDPMVRLQAMRAHAGASIAEEEVAGSLGIPAIRPS